jgi:hypothetical protein
MSITLDLQISKIVVSETLNKRTDYELYENETDINCTFAEDSFWEAIEEGDYLFKILHE